jgi:hypothetical protein
MILDATETVLDISDLIGPSMETRKIQPQENVDGYKN